MQVVYVLVLGRTWFGSEVRSVFWGSVGSRFGFWGPTRGSVGSRFGFDRKNSKNHQFFLILFSKVRGSVWFLGGLVGSRFGFQEQIGGSIGSRVDFWRFKMFVRYFKVWPNTSTLYFHLAWSYTANKMIILWYNEIFQANTTTSHAGTLWC